MTYETMELIVEGVVALAALYFMYKIFKVL